MSHTITLHCKPYVKAYLENKYAVNGIVKLPRRSMLLDVFKNTLEKTYHPSSNYNKKEYPCTIEIQIRVNDLSQHGISIKPAQQTHFNKIIEAKIKQELFIIYTMLRFQGQKPMVALATAQKQLGFEESVFSVESINIAIYRQKKDMYKITNFHPILNL